MIRVRAPGKLFLTGAWAVLEGAPAIVLAVDRFAVASSAGELSTMPEVVAVARRLESPVPHVDVSQMHTNGRKIGLGSSAAACVAAAGAILAARGEPVDRARVIEVALRAHRDVQPRGSGADVVACAHGGVVEARRLGDRLEVHPRALPDALVWQVFALARSASTRDALDRFAERRKTPNVDAAMSALCEAAMAGAQAIARGEAAAFVAATADHVRALDVLGSSLGLPLVPPELEMARELLKTADMPFSTVLFPSGAGGVDTVVWLGARAPTDQEANALERLGLVRLDLSLSARGVHVVSEERDSDHPLRLGQRRGHRE